MTHKLLAELVGDTIGLALAVASWTAVMVVRRVKRHRRAGVGGAQ